MTTAPAQAPDPSLSSPLVAPNAPERGTLGGTMQRAIAVVAVVALVVCVLLWQKVTAMQEQLARQSADAIEQATQAKSNARQAQDLSLETAAKLAVTDAKLGEVALQRTQVEELIQSLSRSRDENLVADIDSAIRLAQQQAQLSGSIDPLLSALKTADIRLSRTAQPRLAPLQRAIARDVARIQATPLSDTPTLLLQLDELALLADDLPVANAVVPVRPSDTLARKPQEAISDWWLRIWAELQADAKDLVRVSKISEPEAALLSPEQSFFLRENFKLRILNARLGLMSRQIDPARADLATASAVLGRYFAPGSRKTQTAAALLLQVQTKMRLLDVPRVDETLAALSTAAAGR
jgi:uroporphyrin-3 C-methyltransferase